MRRIRLPLGHGALFACLTLAALVLLFPLGFALSALGLRDDGLTARAVSGSIWSGRLDEAAFGSLALGDLSARLRVLPLLVGRARVDLSGAAGQGAITVGRHAAGIDDATFALALGRSFAPVPLAGLDLDDVSVRFRDGSCESAEGRVRARFTGNLAGVPLAQGFSGTVRCDAGALLIPLVSQSAIASLTIRIAGDGSWRAAFAVRASDPSLAGPLGALGFARDTGGYGLKIAGKLAG